MTFSHLSDTLNLQLKDKAFVVTRPLEKEVLEDKLNAIEELLSRKTTDIKCNIDQVKGK